MRQAHCQVTKYEEDQFGKKQGSQDAPEKWPRQKRKLSRFDGLKLKYEIGRLIIETCTFKNCAYKADVRNVVRCLPYNFGCRLRFQ